MQVRIDRSLPIGLARQIKGQIVYAISMGLLPAGARLPSVRELSAQLDVAPMTVSQAYRELVEDGVIVTRPGAGTFVADIVGFDRPHVSTVARDNLHQIVENAYRQAATLGYGPNDVRHAFLNHFGPGKANSAPRQVILVGNFHTVSESYARDIEAVLADLNVRVRVLLLPALRAQLSDMLDELRDARLVVTVPTRVAEVRALLEPHGCRVVSIAFRLSIEARRELSEVLPGQRIGVLSTYPEFLSTMMDEVSSFCLAETPPPYALLGQNERLRELVDQIDVLVYASGSEEVLAQLPDRIKAIQLRHSPDPDSVRRLRTFLV